MPRKSTFMPGDGRLTGTTGTAEAPIDMADATHTIVIGKPAGAAQTRITGSTLFVDANSAGTENLVMFSATRVPPGTVICIINVGGEAFTVDTNKLDLAPGEGGFLVSDGTAWTGFGVGANT